LNTLCFHFFDRVTSGREGVRHTSIKTRSRTRGARLLDRARVTVVKSGSVTENRFHQRLVYFAFCAHDSQDSSHCNFSGVHHLLWRSSLDMFQTWQPTCTVTHNHLLIIPCPQTPQQHTCATAVTSPQPHNHAHTTSCVHNLTYTIPRVHHAAQTPQQHTRKTAAATPPQLLNRCSKLLHYTSRTHARTHAHTHVHAHASTRKHTHTETLSYSLHITLHATFLAFITRHVPVPGIPRLWGLRAGVTARRYTIKCGSRRGVRAKLVTAL
jgi:hypothetical protein